MDDDTEWEFVCSVLFKGSDYGTSMDGDKEWKFMCSVHFMEGDTE